MYKELEENKSSQLEQIKKEMEKTYSVFDKCLSEGVEKSKSSWENILKKFLNPPVGNVTVNMNIILFLKNICFK